ncbi:Triose-phosphate Transporter [Serendipita sp. 400]|nr:Triose-phosphate Transporter [Serendipita sp. 400]
MIVQWGLAAAVRRLWPARFKPDVNPSKKDYATKAVPTAVATSLDIGLSNLSLKLITLSFYTMCKSSSLIFVLLFAFLLRLEKPSLRLIFVILLITAGVLLMVFTTTSFSLGGLILVLSASFLGGLRWGLTQILLKKRDMGMNNPAATVFWLAPSMAVTLSITSMAVEGWIRVWNDPFWERVGIFKSLFYLISPGFIAFAMVMSEYYIISRAGVVPMSIAGIFKEVSTIVISAWVFGDHLTELNIIGVAITITGIAVYTYHKYTAALHSAVPLDEHGNPLKEEEAEEGEFPIPITRSCLLTCMPICLSYLSPCHCQPLEYARQRRRSKTFGGWWGVGDPNRRTGRRGRYNRGYSETEPVGTRC